MKKQNKASKSPSKKAYLKIPAAQKTFTFSPLDARYRDMPPEILSEEALLGFQVEVEKKWLLLLMQEGFAPKATESKLDAAFEGLSFEEIEEIEARTQHATRALVEALALRLEQNSLEKLSHWVHVGLTSFDTVDTAARLRLKCFMHGEFKEEFRGLLENLLKISNSKKALKTVGRTHGQWAVPSLFALPFAESADRLLNIWKRIELGTENLQAQSSGAVGGYQGPGLLFKDPLKVEQQFADTLSLKRATASTQIIPPEDIYGLATDIYSAASVVAKLAHDLRHLARSEIAEISEGLRPGQVGSSTMPQKRNPWNLEHVCSLFKVLAAKLSLLENDLLSEHQRDLTNSASGRFYIEFFSVAYLMMARMNKILTRLEVHDKNVKENLKKAGGSVWAESLYILATLEGVPHAHDAVRAASREAEKSGEDLLAVAKTKGLVPKKMSLADLEKKILKGPELKLASLIKSAERDLKKF